MKLCIDAVQPALMKLRKRLMAIEELRDFYLVSGTALALRFGHRFSVDLDLFTLEPFDSAALSKELIRQLGMVQAESMQNTVRGLVGGIKLECITHHSDT